MKLVSRARGCLLGLACGDAVGTSVEFSPPGSFAPLTDMVGGGPFELQPGQWTDDTSMALWCCWRSRSPEEAILMAANLGDDADTTAAIAGQVAGALHGVEALPAHWLARLHQAGEIDHLACALIQGASKGMP